MERLYCIMTHSYTLNALRTKTSTTTRSEDQVDHNMFVATTSFILVYQ